MIFKIEWTFFAELSYFDEIDFIYKKWNSKQVSLFEDLVGNEIIRLSMNPKIGVLKDNNLYSLAISKQTTLFYRVQSELNSIELLLFWNNLKNPNDIQKLL